MPYPAVPDRRIPYDNDGSVLVSAVAAGGVGAGPSTYPTGAQAIAFNGSSYTGSSFGPANGNGAPAFWWFFPESREVTAFYVGIINLAGGWSAVAFQGSSDSTNGLDGTWETATVTPAIPSVSASRMDDWRQTIMAVSFTGPKKVVRFYGTRTGQEVTIAILHLYGEKAAGQTPDDIVYIDHDTTPGVEYTAVEDFGDRPLATTLVRQFRIKNVSGTKTANTINIQCNDTDFAISTDGITWVVTINIASLAPGAESATMYIRNTTPAVGSALGPRFARIITIVGSWT